MTEIQAKIIEFQKGKRFCAVDNHNWKNGKTYDIIFSAKTSMELNRYMYEKGIWE